MINHFGLELTFIGEDGSDFCKSEADRLVGAFNKRLRTVNKHANKTGSHFWTKIDSFKIKSWENTRGNRYLLEINNFPTHPISYVEFTEGNISRDCLQAIFDIGKNLGLAGKVTKRKGKELLEYPNGGGHIHVQMDLFDNNFSFLRKLADFQENLFIDYSNRPYIRWLFSQWFDNNNSSVTFTENQLWDEFPIINKEYILSSVDMSHGIRPRFQNIGKTVYPTYEFRFFNAIESVKELELQVAFLNSWIRFVRDRGQISFTLKAKDFKKFKKLGSAWKEISRFLKQIGLNPKDYRRFFDENYKNRILYGKLV